MKSIRKLAISSIPEISAIYFALLQCGYDYYAIERSTEHSSSIQGFAGTEKVPSFFSLVKQDTCEVYPYWPRAAILETATFYLLPDHSRFQNYDAFRNLILSAGNIADHERDHRLWSWMEDFPSALSNVLASDGFQRYRKWETEWVAKQTARYQEEFRLLQECTDICISRYGSPVKDLRIVINPIKCVYSSDYHLSGNCFVFSSGAFRVESVIHEFLHHVVHPAVAAVRDEVLVGKRKYADIDESYYLSGDHAGQLNAFEEYAVRTLTKDVMKGCCPNTLVSFLRELSQ